MSVVVLRCAPPQILTMTWTYLDRESEVTIELTPRGSDVALVVTHRRLPDRATMLSIAGGWHAHLGVLIDRLNGRPTPAFWSTHARLEEEYGRRIPVTT